MAEPRTLCAFCLRDMPIFLQSPLSNRGANLITGVMDPRPTIRRVLRFAAKSLLRFVRFDEGEGLSFSSRHWSREIISGATTEVYSMGAAIS